MCQGGRMKVSHPCKFSVLFTSMFLLYTSQVQAKELIGVNKNTIVLKEVKHDVSKPLRDFPATSDSELASRPHRIIPIFHTPPIPKSTQPDTVIQSAIISQLAIPFKAFQGVGVGLGNYQPNLAPPDTNGAAGLTQYVQWVNTDFAVFNKSTGAILAGYPKPGNSLWSGFGGNCETHNDGDIIIKYDQLANRWIFTQFAIDTTNNIYAQCVAISTTSDATGTYFRYQFPQDSFNDYPKLGVWPDAYYISFNMFGPVSNGPRICAMDRTKMLAGQAATMQCKQLSWNTAGSLLPADLDGKILPPANSPEFVMTFLFSNALTMFKYHVDFVNPSNTTLSSGINIPVASFVTSGDASQPNTTQLLDALSDRLMYRLAYRQFATYGTMVVNHSVQGTSSAPAIRWYEVRMSNNGSFTPSLFQQGTFSPDANGRFMGSIAMDKVGNIAVGYSLSSATIFPSIAFSTRIPTDPLGTLGNETKIISGTGSQTNLNRWGDYSSMAIDPSDDCTFWYTNEYIKANGSFNWSTYVGNFQLAGCTSPPPPPPGDRIPI